MADSSAAGEVAVTALAATAAVAAGEENVPAAAAAAAARKTNKVRMRVSEAYIETLLAHPPSERRLARIPTKDMFRSFSPEIQDRFVSRCTKIAGMLNARRDRDMDILEQYRSHGCAYEVLEAEEDALERYRSNGGVYEEVDD